MTVNLSNPIVAPQDGGMGLSDPETADFTSAGHQAVQHTRGNTQDYVETGLSMTPDYANGTVDISGGLVHVNHPNTIQVQDQNGDYVNDIEHGVTLTVAVPSAAGIPLDSGTENDIYLSLDLSTNNSAEYVIRPADTFPTEPYLHIGTVDTANNVTEEVNREPDGSYGDLAAIDFTADGVDIDNRNVIDASNHGYPGDRSGGDIMTLFRDNPNSTFILPDGEYSVQSELNLQDDADWDELTIIGEPHARLVVDDTSVGLFADLGLSSGGTFSRLSLQNLTLVVDGPNGYDAGWGRWNIDDRVENKNLSLEGLRDYWDGGDGSGNATGGDKFAYYCNITTESGVGIHQNINLNDGDSPYNSAERQDHAVGFGSEPGHVGTQYWIGCSVEEYWDNGFYVKDGDGPNILIGCRAANCGGANFRLGASDVAMGCRSDWNYDLSSNDGFEGTLLDCDDGHSTSVTGFRGVNDTSTTDAVRIRSASENATYRDLEIDNNTSQFALRISGTTGTHTDGVLKVDNVRITDTGGTSTRTSAVCVQRPQTHLMDLSVDTTGGGSSRCAIKVESGGVRVSGLSRLKSSASYSVILGDSAGGNTITRTHLDGTYLSGGIYIYGDDTIEAVHLTDCDLRDQANLFEGGGPSDIGTFITQGCLGEKDRVGTVDMDEITGSIANGDSITNISGNIYVQNTEPTAQNEGDIWIDTS